MKTYQIRAFSFVFSFIFAAVLRGEKDPESPRGLQLTASTAPAGDWPSYRRDGALSGFSPLRGGLSQPPQRLWTVNLGGTTTNLEAVRFADVNGDGRDELLRVLPNQVVCQTIGGRRLWETTALAEPRITHIRDFAGDGTRGLLIDTNTGVEHRRYLVSGKSGVATQLYASRNVFGRYERTGKILNEVPGEQLCAWWSGDPVTNFGGDGMRGVGYLWSFEQGLENPTLRFHAEEVGTIYAPLHLFADMDRDGRRDMVMISHEEIWVYDLATGKKMMQQSWGPRIRTYWAATAAEPLRPGEPPSLLMINPMIPGVQVVTQDGNKVLRKWKQVVGDSENQYQKKVKIDKAAPDPFVDLNGDGELEILAAVTNEHGDQQTHLVIFRANDGRRIYDSPVKRVLTVDDLDGAAPPEVILEKKQGTLAICNWNGTTLVERWRSAGVTPLIEQAPPEGHLARAIGARSSSRNMPLKRASENPDQFILKFSDGLFGCRLSGNSLKRIRPIDGQSLRAVKPRVPDYQWDGRTLWTNEDDRQVISYQVPQRQNYLADPPLVGTLGARRRVIVREHSGDLVSFPAEGGVRKVVISATPTATGASIVDLNGDGVNELLATTAAPTGSQVVSVDHTGRRRLTIQPPTNATETALGPTGRLGKKKGRWFVVRYRIQSDNTRVVAYDGKDGAVLWTRDFLGPRHTPSTTFVLHLPTAVYDVDGDGADDLIASSENWYEVISVRDNRSVTPNGTITAAVPGHWGAYATPIVADVLGNRQPIVFHNNAYALTLLTQFDGTPVWHYGLTRDTTHASQAGLADLDGDGTIELVTSQKDGLLRAYNAAALRTKCPHCPAGQPLSGANHSGEVRWTFRLTPPLSDFCSIDLDGDGNTELLCGSGDGKLYALKEDENRCAVLWTVDLGAAVGAPVAADLNGDSLPEILVTSSDGRLHCLNSISK